MPEKNMTTIGKLYEALGRGDIPSFLAGLDSQIEWREADHFPYADGNPYIGPQAVLEGVFTRLGSEWEGFAGIPDDWLDAGDRIVVLGTYTGKNKATGKSVRAQFAHVWTVKDGKAIRMQQYTDTKQFADAIT